MVGADDVETFLDPAAELILASPSPTRLAQACTRQGAPAADIPSAKKACAAGDADACASLGAAAMCRAHDADANANAEPALGTLERSCALGSDDGCHQFATALVAGNLGRRDVGRGLRVHHRACSNGSARACGSLGSVLVSIRKPAAISRGASYLEKACAGGYLDSCGSLAIIEASGAGSRAKNPERAATIARDACEKRNALSCGVLGALKVRGLGVAKDEASGVKLLAVACNAGDERLHEPRDLPLQRDRRGPRHPQGDRALREGLRRREQAGVHDPRGGQRCSSGHRPVGGERARVLRDGTWRHDHGPDGASGPPPRTPSRRASNRGPLTTALCERTGRTTRSRAHRRWRPRQDSNL